MSASEFRSPADSMLCLVRAVLVVLLMSGSVLSAGAVPNCEAINALQDKTFSNSVNLDGFTAATVAKLTTGASAKHLCKISKNREADKLYILDTSVNQGDA